MKNKLFSILYGQSATVSVIYMAASFTALDYWKDLARYAEGILKQSKVGCFHVDIQNNIVQQLTVLGTFVLLYYYYLSKLYSLILLIILFKCMTDISNNAYPGTS